MAQEQSIFRKALTIGGVVLAALLIAAGAFFGGYLYRNDLQQMREAEAQKEKCRIEVSSEPKGLTVFVDDKEQEQKTPISLNNLDPGKYKIRLESDETSDWAATVRVTPGETFSIEAIAPKKTSQKESKEAGSEEDEEETSSADLTAAAAMINKFMALRMERDAASALDYCTAKAKKLYAPPDSVVLGGISNPHYARYEVLKKKKVSSAKYTFVVRIFEELSGEGETGSFDETITVVKSGGKYLVDVIEQDK